MNALAIPADFQECDCPIDNPPAVSADGLTTVYFRRIERHLIGHILRAPVVVGCVAWLTSEPILEALSRCEGVSIVVQKEDFLRPDIAPRRGWAKKLRSLYGALPLTLDRNHENIHVLAILSSNLSLDIDPVRCVGNHNRNHSAASPRSHHKFVVFCRREYRDFPIGDSGGEDRPVILPYAAWTGSFNFTKNASHSLENAIYTEDPYLVGAFYREWAQVCALSEPLDWSSPWVEPEWRIGT